MYVIRSDVTCHSKAEPLAWMCMQKYSRKASGTFDVSIKEYMITTYTENEMERTLLKERLDNSFLIRSLFSLNRYHAARGDHF